MKTVHEKDLLFLLLLASFFDSSYCENMSVTTEAAKIAKDEHICFQIDSRDYCLKTSFKSVAQWKDSIAQCSAIGATLVTNLTSTLMSDISSKLHQIFSELKMSESVKFIWVGLSYTGDSNGNFEWLNKEKLSSESALWDSGFYGGQPNNHDGRVGESCAALQIQTAKLVDLNCNRPQFFMCTKDD
ncbi:C-type lectin domain family 4 member M-like isoform X2 [Cloeon dipterum]|uniref:C-type lectin domain family 4 member M-like isoform X2 n=1 Tax=Cloeon dipterum TaxID=197152 RepID=UPI00322044AA